MLALRVPLDEAVEAALLALGKLPLDTFLEAVRQNFCAAREIITQDPPLVPHLVTGGDQRHATDAHDQGQDNFQSRAHPSSSIQEMKIDRESWVHAAALN